MPRRGQWAAGAVAALVTLAGAASPARSAGSGQWQHGGSGAFSKATLDGTVVDSLGRVSLAYALDALHKPDKTPFVWSLAVDAKGRVLAGTGNQGRLFAIDVKNKKVDLLYDSDELEILSLAVAEDGTVYIGSGPKGKIYRIAPDGKATVYYQTGAGYVWALALGAKGDLYAGTGPEGKIYRVTGPDVGQVLYDSPHTHVLSLATDGAGRLYAGSDRDGLIYRIEPASGVFVLYDAPQREIRALHVEADGTVYAAATGSGGSAGARSAPAPRTSGSESGASPTSTSRTTSSRGSGGGGAIYRIAPTGAVKILFQPKEGSVLALARRRNALLVATGDEARLYQVDLDRPDAVTMLTKVKAKQILALAVGPDGACYVGTANPGEVLQVSARRAAAGTLTSDVLDARFAASWGRIRWRGETPEGTQVTAACRTGNVAKPDDTWSPWSKDAADPPDRRRFASARIDRPAARYLQYRLTLSAKDRMLTPVVREVAVGYLPANQAPEVLGIAEAGTTGKPGAPAASKNGPRPKPKTGNPGAANGLKFKWTVRDPNGDALRYSVLFRGEGETLWKPLADTLTKPEYVWKIDSVPDGRYRLKVVASDASANSPDRALTGSRVSEVIVVDQTAPTVTVDGVVALPKGRQVNARAADNLSDIVSAAWSLDGEPWSEALPNDRIFDDSDEAFVIVLDGLEPGEHTFVLRVADSEGNVGAGKTVIQVQP